jgi:small nuclear ribonucleoprotein
MSKISRDGPLQILKENVGKTILLRIRGNREIRCILRSYDAHLNLHVDDAVILADDEQELPEEQLGQLIVRGDNVIFISPP